ncbi:MAG: FxLYD domain-containing protein [Candidatus Polarisedimenticolia bacterium]
MTRHARALLVLIALLTPMAPIGAQEPEGGTTNSARYKFEGNKWLALDLSVGDVRAETIRFEWPATILRVKTAYKATVKVANGSSRQARIGVAVALYDADGRLIGAGSGGTTLGTIDPGDVAQFDVDFAHVTQRLEQAAQFHIALESR